MVDSAVPLLAIIVASMVMALIASMSGDDDGFGY